MWAPILIHPYRLSLCHLIRYCWTRQKNKMSLRPKHHKKKNGNFIHNHYVLRVSSDIKQWLQEYKNRQTQLKIWRIILKIKTNIKLCGARESVLPKSENTSWHHTCRLELGIRLEMQWPAIPWRRVHRHWPDRMASQTREPNDGDNPRPFQECFGRHLKMGPKCKV